MCRYFWSDEPEEDERRMMNAKEERLKRLPVCDCCGEPIQQDKAVYYNNQWSCEDCEDTFWLGIREDFLESVEN